MNARTRRTLGAATLVAAMVSVTSCSAGSEATAGGQSGGADGPVTIKYMHRLPDGAGMTKVSEIVSRWNADHPDVQVKATKFDGQADEMITKLKADIQAGTAPCLAQLGYAEVPTMYSDGMLEDVTDEAQQYADNYSAGSMALMTVGDKVVGLPQDTGPLVYYYNAAAFDKLGLKVPTTSAELAAVAAKAADQGKYALAFQPDEAQNWLSGQAAAAGATWYAAEDGKWKVNTVGDATQTVASFWQGLLDDGEALVANRWSNSFKQALVNQKLIGTIGAAWEAPLLAADMADSPNAGHWRVAELPAFSPEGMTGPDGGSGVAVLKGCDHPEQAMKFNNWFNTQVDDLVSQGLVVAATTEPMTTPDEVKAFYGGQDVFGVLAEANKALNPEFTYIPNFPVTHGPMTQAAAAAGKGKAPVLGIFEAAQKASVTALKDAGLPVAQ